MNKTFLSLACLLILAVFLGGFLSVYLRRTPERIPEKVQPAFPEEPAQSPFSPSSPRSLPPYIRVGIIGESRSNGLDSQPFNKEVLKSLLEVMKEQKVEAVFATGNLVYGWLKSSSDSKNPTDTYNSAAFRGQLESFADLFKQVFENTAELYPLMGSHEAIGPDAAKIFREVFDIPDTIPPTDEFIAYSVSIGNAFFALLPTDYYDSQQGRPRINAIPASALQWLKNTLALASKSHRFLFVLGHEPAFMGQTILNHSQGLDEHTEQRDLFWKILKDHRVLAYFASRERLYDRTNRFGVWQVISGGGGALLSSRALADAFFHGLILTLPQNDTDMPSMKVFDTDGHIRDEFELKLEPEQQPLYQMRISLLSI